MSASFFLYTQDKKESLLLKVKNPKSAPFPSTLLAPFKSSRDCFSLPYQKLSILLPRLKEYGDLFFEDQKLLINSFTHLLFSYDLKIENDSYLITGSVGTKKRNFPLSECDFFCPYGEAFVIKAGLLFFLDEAVDGIDLERLGDQLSPPEKEAFVQKALKAGIVCHVDTSSDVQLEIYPLLIIEDSQGSFAKLFFEYPDSLINSQSEEKRSQRDFPQEKHWEQDLIEVGYIKKKLPKSDYYCPLPQVFSSLSFLLEMGWKIQDTTKRNLFLGKDISLEYQGSGHQISVQGSLSYGDGSLPLEAIFPYMEKEKGLCPWENKVILLDLQTIKKSCSPFQKEGNRILLAKEDFYRLDLQKSWAPSLQALQAFLKGDYGKAPPLDSFHGKLRAYQSKGLAWMHFLKRENFHALLADEMGLGKTVQVLAFLSSQARSLHLLIAPSSLMDNWQRECKKFCPDLACIIHRGPQRASCVEELPSEGLILCSYDLLRQDISWLSEICFDSLILDEAQKIKNPSSLSAKACKLLKGKLRLCMSGTPIENSIQDLWSLFSFLMPSFAQRYKKLQTEGKAFIQASQSFILRRKKEEVAKDLPSKIEHTQWISLHEQQKELYQDILTDQKRTTKDGALFLLEKILRLRQLCCHPQILPPHLRSSCPSNKFTACLLDLEELIEKGEKILLFSQFTSMLQLFAQEARERNWPFLILEGATKKPQLVIDAFTQAEGPSLFLISLKAGGLGLNLQTADSVILYDPWWNSAAEEQAIDRAHRIGRTKSLSIRRYLCSSSIEEKVQALKEKKQSLSQGIFQDTSLSLEELESLLS